jgi:hypothetical protein
MGDYSIAIDVEGQQFRDVGLTDDIRNGQFSEGFRDPPIGRTASENDLPVALEQCSG